MTFAKVFDRPDYGQVVVMLGIDPDDSFPEIRFFAQPPGHDVCNFALGFEQHDGEERARAEFDKVDEAKADEAGRILFGLCGAED